MKTHDLTVSRTIPGSADDVFDVWLDPKSPGGLWFGVERAILNPVVDGLFYVRCSRLSAGSSGGCVVSLWKSGIAQHAGPAGETHGWPRIDARAGCEWIRRNTGPVAQ
jgi:hypothetical protein